MTWNQFKRKHSEATRERALKLVFEHDFTMKQAAFATGAGYSTVHFWFRQRRKLDPEAVWQPGRKSAYPIKLRFAVIAKVKAGEITPQEAAHLVGCCRAVMHRWLAYQGIKYSQARAQYLARIASELPREKQEKEPTV